MRTVQIDDHVVKIPRFEQLRRAARNREELGAVWPGWLVENAGKPRKSYGLFSYQADANRCESLI
jgi:hypothetical protein